MKHKGFINYGLILSALGFIVFSLNCYNYYLKTNTFSFVNNLNILILIISITVLVTSFYKIGIYIQILCLSFTGLITFYLHPTDSSGILQLIIVLILIKKYNLFENRKILKTIIFSGIILITLVLSLIFKEQTLFSLIPTICLYAFFIFSTIFILKHERKKYILYENETKKELVELKEDYNIIKTNLKESNTFVDPVEAGLTAKELALLECLCIYRGTNIDLGQRLNKSPHTIKVQLTKIMIKIGAESRYDLMELCKNYFQLNNLSPQNR
ncbi:LuxR family transcriptional regulator [Thiospirochaeta perfilievii]|uniref:LuxR family transcriptional regulator n=1 Tax=Thiospirochaeta perfilievii TaxID=252967 RepID=A0A5C1Q7Y5_9SPIO|nr:helix-turn-helix transcriptional regulator [Thiospirochaeta perfilievii]QEN04155.1 LuxR family transcriptional regulator [Thiospirochaeta perfilievii]